MQALRLGLRQTPGSTLAIDLQAQTIVDAAARVFRFRVDPRHREQLLSGEDDISRTLAHERVIAGFERRCAVEATGIAPQRT